MTRTHRRVHAILAPVFLIGAIVAGLVLWLS